MKTIFDVGANDGQSTLSQSEGNIVYAFEPTPELVIKLKQYESPTYHVIQKAVSNFNGKAKFHVAGQSDWGCSSLYEFSEGLDKTWPGRTDFKVTQEIEVDVIRLDTFIEQHNIKKIDYFHCDTQGSDVKVLEGLGKYLSIIKEGRIEVAKDLETSLYKTDNTLEKALEILKDFKTWKTPCFNEYDLCFSR
jgi:FkbM family methyltransferase